MRQQALDTAQTVAGPCRAAGFGSATRIRGLAEALFDLGLGEDPVRLVHDGRSFLLAEASPMAGSRYRAGSRPKSRTGYVRGRS
jgi:hypothetical protein